MKPSMCKGNLQKHEVGVAGRTSASAPGRQCAADRARGGISDDGGGARRPIKRLPEGETGDRSNWIGWQISFLQQSPQLELVPPPSETYAPLPSQLHLPGPRDRSDDAYFAPVGDLRPHPETELYLGLVHATDGLEGTCRRMAAARAYARSFGVATECGLGRRPSETILEVLQLHVDALAVPG